MEKFFDEEGGNYHGINEPPTPMDFPYHSPYQSEESRYEGSEGYFMLHGREAIMPCDKSKPGYFTAWDRTLTLQVRNISVIPGDIVPCILFGSAGQAQPTLDSEVSMPDYETPFLPPGVNVFQEPVMNEILANPFVVKGLRMIFVRSGAPAQDFVDQINEPFVLQDRSITGKLNQFSFQTQNGMSPSIINQQSADFAVLDFVDFKIDPKRDFDILYNMRRDMSVFFVFTLTMRTEIPNIFFNRNAVSTCDTIRPSGNPLGDIAMERMACRILEESGYNSTAQYAFAPRPSGNPVADIELLNQPAA